jgi:phage shock protein A
MESLVEKNVRLRREVAELKSANERLELRVQELERRVQELLRALEEHNAPGSVKRLRSRGTSRKPIQPSRGGKRGQVWLP